MGQSNIQKRVQHQDVELWELYDEDERRGNRNIRYAGAARNNRGGSARRSSQGGSSGPNVSARRSNRRENAERNSRGRTDYRSGLSADAVTRNGEDRRVINGYGQEQRSSRPGTAGTVKKQVNIRRQHENTGQVRRAARTADASQISYIQPYPRTGERRSSSAVYRGNARPLQSIKRRRARRRREFLCKAVIVLLITLCLAMVYFITGQIYQMLHRSNAENADVSLPAMTEQIFDDDTLIAPPELTQDFLEINEYSRPGTPLDEINSIFVHYTANPGTSAAQNRSYFANLAQTHERSASAHLIIGYEGELIQCIPFDEQAYAVMTRNEDSISIECCFLSEDGSFTQETYDTLIHTLAWLLDKYDLSTGDILRHYDCGGKLCPLYYAENEDAWEQLRRDVADYMAAARE